MFSSKKCSIKLFLVGLLLLSLLVGCLIPSFYRWTDSDQSRPSPLLLQVPIASALASLAFCISLPWLPITKSIADDTRVKLRFSIRILLMLTTAIALLVALLAKFPSVASGILLAAAYLALVAFGIRQPNHRMASLALIGCMILPFAWLVSYDELNRILPSLVAMFSGMPAFVPAALVGSLFGQNLHDIYWLNNLFTAAELLMGIYIIQLGPKQTIAYLLLIMHISAFGSLVFLQLILA